MKDVKVDANKVIEQLRVLISNLTYENVLLKTQLEQLKSEEKQPKAE